MSASLTQDNRMTEAELYNLKLPAVLHIQDTLGNRAHFINVFERTESRVCFDIHVTRLYNSNKRYIIFHDRDNLRGFSGDAILTGNILTGTNKVSNQKAKKSMIAMALGR